MAEKEKQEQQQQPAQPVRVALKKAKKKWVGIVASKEFNQVFLGETYVFESEQAVGKMIEVNLMSLTHDAKKQNAKVIFEVFEVKNNQAFTNLTGYEMLSSHVKRLTKKAKGKIDASFTFMTADNVKVQVKPLIVVRTKAHKSILTKMQKEIKMWLEEVAKKSSYPQFMNDVISGALQRDMKNVAKKFYSVTTCVIRIAERRK